MTLTTFAVDTPAPGDDWSFTIPGINLVALRTITAEFLTDLADPDVVVVVDSSGNGYDLAIHEPPSTQNLMLGQPGALADDAATAFSDLAGTTSYGVALNPATYPVDFSGDFSVEWWERVGPGALFPIPIGFTPTGSPGWNVEINGAGTVFLSDHTHGDYIAPNCFLFDSAWHHYVWTWDQAAQGNVQFYVDGVAVAGLARPGGYPVRPFGLQLIELGDINPSDEVGHLDEVALYSRQLSAGEVAAHFAAAANGVVDYTLAVLTSGAVAYWHLDDLATDAPRLPTLEVLNGLTLLGDYPAPVVQEVARDVNYTWFSDARGTPGSATPAVVTVGVPPLVLPPGYTLRSATAGIQSADQWQNVRVLWDDALQQITAGYNPYAFPPGAFLTYKQAGN